MYIIIIINNSYNNSAAHGTDSFHASPEPLGNGETSFQQRQQQPTLLTPLCELRDCGRNASFCVCVVFFFFFFFFCTFCFCFESEYPGRSHVGSLFTNKELKRVGSWRHWYFCYTCRPCLWCHWHTADGQNMAALTVVSSRLYKRHFLTERTRNGVEKLLCVLLLFIPFLAIGSVVLLRFGSPLTFLLHSIFLCILHI